MTRLGRRVFEVTVDIAVWPAAAVVGALLLVGGLGVVIGVGLFRAYDWLEDKYRGD